jgi:omega-6 fatty acid desaturase (delta-12 desaturase)
MRWIAHREKLPAWSAYLQTLLGGTSGSEAVEVQEPAPALDREGYHALRDQLDFRPSLVPTLGIVALDVLLVAAAVALLQRAGWAAWLTSQALLAVVFFNAFSILHECGHGSASRSPLVNTALGHLASTFCFVPYFPWKLIHRQHHLWTGNLDRDPSLRSLRRFRDQGVPRAVAWSWRAWIPLAGLMQHLVFLTYPLVLHRAGGLTRGKLVRTIFSILWLPASWLALWRLAPGLVRPGQVGGALLLFLVMEELVNLPHHVGMPTSNQRLPPWEQHRATRSCHYPRGLSELLVLNFNFHVEHHLFPSLPWYRLRQARGLLQRTMAGRYQECAGASWNLKERGRPLALVIAGARPEQERP